MKKVQKRILTVIVSLTITGSGIATYLRYSGNSFDPEKYTRNSAWNRNQITFDDDQTDDEYMIPQRTAASWNRMTMLTRRRRLQNSVTMPFCLNPRRRRI